MPRFPRPTLLVATLSLGAAAASAAPVPTGISPAVAVPGQILTVTGTGLVQSGKSLSIMFQRKYLQPGESSIGSATVSTSTATSVTFPAPANAVPNSFKLRYRETTGGRTGGALALPALEIHAIPGSVHVKEAPVITGDNAVGGALDAVTPARVFKPGAGRTFEIHGRNLVPPPGTAVGFSIGTASYSAGATARYDTTSNGRDVLTVTIGEPAVSFVGSATATTVAGSGTATNRVVVRRPRFTAIEEIDASGAVIGPAGARMLRGRRYQVRGSDLSFPSARPLAMVSRVDLSPAASHPDSTVDANRHVFTFPPVYASPTVALTLRGPGGDVSLGSFTVSDAGALPPSLAGLVVSPTPAVHGTTLNAVVSFAGTVTPGVDVGGVEFTSSNNSRMVGLPKTVAITGNPMTVTLPTLVRSAAETRTITARLTRATGGTNQLAATASLTPPAFTGLTPATLEVPGGTPVTLQALFDFPAGAPASCGNLPLTPPDLEVRVGTTNDNLVQLGNVLSGTVDRVCVRAPSQPIEFLTDPVAAATPVTVSVTCGATTRTATVTLTPPTFNGLTLDRAGLVSMQSATGTLALSSAMSGAFALLASNDPAVSVPAKVTFGPGATLAFPVTTLPVSSARPATISAVVNGVTKSASLTLAPLEFQSLAFGPASPRSGSNTAATLQLNATVDLPFTVALSSSDPAVATVPASVSFAAGQNAAVFSVQTAAGLTTRRDVTLTATYSVTLPTGAVVTTTRSAVLTVTP